MNQNKRIGFLIILLAFTFQVFAQSSTPKAVAVNAQDDFKKIMGPINTISFEFQQKVYDDVNTLLSQSMGKCAISRPKRFRWDITQPFEQLTVSDGAIVYQYDAELSQVFKSKLAGYQTSPALVLSGDMNVVASLFSIEKYDCKDEKKPICFKLIPNKHDPFVQNMVLSFDANKTPNFIMLKDILNHKTTIELRGVSINPKLTDDVFQFTPPDGSDIIDEVH